MVETQLSCKNPYSWSWLGMLIMWFIVLTVLFWLVYYSLKPSFVLQNDSNQIDTTKVLLAAIISSIILVFVVWLIKLALATINKRKIKQ
jgi:cell division protein FtsX